MAPFLLPKYLTVPRAIVCIKSEETGGGILDSHRSGAGGGAELLHDLEEQMEVARVQLSVADAMIAVHPRTPEVEQAIAQVGYAFFTLGKKDDREGFFIKVTILVGCCAMVGLSILVLFSS